MQAQVNDVTRRRETPLVTPNTHIDVARRGKTLLVTSILIFDVTRRGKTLLVTPDTSINVARRVLSPLVTSILIFGVARRGRTLLVTPDTSIDVARRPRHAEHPLNEDEANAANKEERPNTNEDDARRCPHSLETITRLQLPTPTKILLVADRPPPSRNDNGRAFSARSCPPLPVCLRLSV